MLTNNWQPANEAPDGVEVLATYKNEYGHRRVVRANWLARYKHEANDSDFYEFPPDGGEDEGVAYAPEGWYELIDNWDDYSSVFINYQVDYFCELPVFNEEEF